MAKQVTKFERFPPTVVDSTEYDDGVIDLELLDSGTEEDPRFIRVFPDSHEKDTVGHL